MSDDHQNQHHDKNDNMNDDPADQPTDHEHAGRATDLDHAEPNQAGTDETAGPDESLAGQVPETLSPESASAAGQPDASDVAATEGSSAVTGVQYAVVDPGELVIGANHRGAPALDKDFLASIRDRGVQEPIAVRRRHDGALVVRKGKRRTLAALEVGRTAVPVLIHPDADPGEDDVAGQIERIVDQVEENDHRKANTEAEQVGAVQQLLDLGLSPAAIARRTHRRPKVVKAQAAVARSALLTAAMARYDGMTLDRAAATAEFDDGTDEGVEAVKALIVCAEKQPNQYEHLLQRLRDERTRRQLLAGKLAELDAAGVRVVPEEDAEQVAKITGLRPSAEDESGTELTEEAHRSCPGHAALLSIKRGWGGDPDSVVTQWVCTDAAANGHRARFDGPATTSAASEAGGGAGGGGSVTGLGQPRRMTEEEKAERRTVVANNKAWDSATSVRKRWLRETFLQRKTAPKNAHLFIAATLARGGHPLRKAMESRHLVACELLGLPSPQGWGTNQPISAQVENASSTRATILTLAILLGAAEQSVGRHTWRRPDDEAVAYFTALQGWGYTLSPVEQLVLGINPDTVTDTVTDTDSVTDSAAGPDDAPAHDPDADPDPEPVESAVTASADGAPIAGAIEHDPATVAAAEADGHPGPDVGSHASGHRAAEDANRDGETADDGPDGRADGGADGGAHDAAGGVPDARRGLRG